MSLLSTICLLVAAFNINVLECSKVRALDRHPNCDSKLRPLKTENFHQYIIAIQMRIICHLNRDANQSKVTIMGGGFKACMYHNDSLNSTWEVMDAYRFLEADGDKEQRAVLIKIGLYVCVKLSVIQNHKGSN
jgi:hypothetical protein